MFLNDTIIKLMDVSLRNLTKGCEYVREILRNLRIKNGFTQQSMANCLKIKRTTYTNIELGNKNPSLNIAIQIKTLLNYTDDNIFFDL